MHRAAKWAAAVAGGVAGVAAVAAVAACIPIATLNLSPGSVQPGATVTAQIHAVSASAGTQAQPVTFHWMSPTGPVLATATPTDTGTTATFTVPEVSQAGDYLIVATQPATPGSSTWGMPARAVLHVTMPGGDPAIPATTGGHSAGARPAGLVTGSGLGIGVLVLIALGVAAAGLSVVGVATWAVGRGARPEQVKG